MMTSLPTSESSSAAGHVIVRSSSPAATDMPVAIASTKAHDDVELGGRRHSDEAVGDEDDGAETAGDVDENDDEDEDVDGCRHASGTIPTPPPAAAAAPVDGKTTDDDDDNELLLPFPEFEPKSLLVFGQTTRPRSWCLKMITWPYPFLCCAVTFYRMTLIPDAGRRSSVR